METHLEKELKDLKLKILEMSSVTEKAVAGAIKTMNERDSDLAEKIIEQDSSINSMQCGVDEKALQMLARDQPVAKDLRTILGSTSIAANLERLGDQAVNICERVMLLAQRPSMPHNPLLEQLADHVQEMLSTVIVAFNHEDVDMANKVCEMDNTADNLDLKNLKHYIEYMIDESRAVERAVHLIMISKSLERIGDLSTNIAENIIFILKGVDIRQACRPY